VHCANDAVNKWFDHVRHIRERNRRLEFNVQREASRDRRGRRQANVLDLQWSAVDLGRRTAWVHGDEAKGGEAIGVPLNDDAMAVLNEEKGKHPERVFTYKGRPFGQVNTRSWRNALKRAGIKNFRWHDLRHVWATWHVMAGTTMAELQELGAWKSALMVKRYAHFAPEQLRAAAAKLGFVYSTGKRSAESRARS
jgi:integrase